MPYNFAADSFHTKKLCSRLSSSEVHFLIEIGRFAFLRPPLGDLEATYDDHLRLIGKRVVDFLLALIELFFARCYGWGASSDYWLKIGDFVPTGAGWPKFQVEGVAPPPPTILILRKLGEMFFRMVHKSGQIFLPFCHNTRVWQTDGQTDSRTDRQNSHHNTASALHAAR